MGSIPGRSNTPAHKPYVIHTAREYKGVASYPFSPAKYGQFGVDVSAAGRLKV